MRLYKTDMGGWAGTQADAKKLASEDGSEGLWAQVEVPTDKPGLLAFLNDSFAWSPDREPVWRRTRDGALFTGRDGTVPLAPAELSPPPQSAGNRHAAQLLAFEDEFESFPLARKLHFAELALAEARSAIKP